MHTTTKSQNFELVKAWVLTTRPKTLILSVIPFIVSTILAKSDVGRINFGLMGFAILSALFIQIATNFINDVYDVKNMADKSTRIGPKRGLHSLVLSSTEVYLAAMACFALALIFAIPLVIKGGFFVGVLMLVSIASGYFYTGGPKPLAYNGLGELFVIVFFGFVSTTLGYYFQTESINLKIALVGLQLGLLASLPIAINNLRDIHDDELVEKRTLAVRFGKRFARLEITFLAFFPFFLNLFFEDVSLLIAPLISLPIAIKIVKHVWDHEPQPSYNQMLGFSILLYTLFSLTITVLLSST